MMPPRCPGGEASFPSCAGVTIDNDDAAVVTQPGGTQNEGRRRKQAALSDLEVRNKIALPIWAILSRLRGALRTGIRIL